MAAVTDKVALTASYALVATAAVRGAFATSNVAVIRLIPTGGAAPADSDAGLTLCEDDDAFVVNAFGSAVDVYAKGKGYLQLFTNTA